MIRALTIKEITGPTVTPGADEAKYHSLGEFAERGDPARVMSRSQLALFDECPREWMDGAKVERTKAMDWGTLMDARITNPSMLAKFVPAPATYQAPESLKKCAPMVDKPWNMNATVCKDWWAMQEKMGLIPVKSEIWEASKLATVALCRDKIAGAFVASCEFQVQVLCEWVDEITGIVVPLKCLVDLVPNFARLAGTENERIAYSTQPWNWDVFLGDFKTANDLSAHGWQRTVFDQDYHVQAALYLDAWNAATGEKRNTFVHILQKSSAPFQTARRMLDEEYLELGRLTYRRQLNRYCQCLQSGEWPDYDSDRQEFGEIIDGFRLVSPLPWMIGA